MSIPTQGVPAHFNYAKEIGFHSVPAAVVFTVLYAPLLGFFVLQSFRIPTYVHIILAFFCQIRVAAFVIRAVLAGSKTAGETLGLFIADEILFGVGFFGLLYSAYTLVLDRELLIDEPYPKHPILQLATNRGLFRILMSGAVAMGITSSTMTAPKSASTAAALHKASVVIFLVLTVIQALLTLRLARAELSGNRTYKTTNESLGMKHGSYVLVVISLLLVVREAFSAATVNNSLRQNEEQLWYPLLALPEFLAVCLYATPGLVPRRDELKQHERGNNTVLKPMNEGSEPYA